MWDLPTRLFHWALGAAVVGLVATGIGGAFAWHYRLGYATLALLVFRVIWGLVGGHWSRFGGFIYSPRSSWAYLRGRGRPADEVGHSPLGALSVWAMLALLIAQVATGLMADDEIDAAGPLAHLVPGAVVAAASKWHVVYGKYSVIALVCLHVLAILFYTLVRRRRIIQPMIGGDKHVPAGTTASRDDALSRGGAAILFAFCLALAWWIASLRP